MNVEWDPDLREHSLANEKLLTILESIEDYLRIRKNLSTAGIAEMREVLTLEAFESRARHLDKKRKACHLRWRYERGRSVLRNKVQVQQWWLQQQLHPSCLQRWVTVFEAHQGNTVHFSNQEMTDQTRAFIEKQSAFLEEQYIYDCFRFDMQLKLEEEYYSRAPV